MITKFRETFIGLKVFRKFGLNFKALRCFNNNIINYKFTISELRNF